MKFIFEVEDFANHSSAQHQFYIKKNEVGNYCAYHTNAQLSYMRVMPDGSIESAPFCWAKRKRDLDDALSEISEYYPEEIEKQFLDKYIAKQLGIHSYGEPYSHWISLENNKDNAKSIVESDANGPSNNSVIIPHYLYHATYKPFLKNILNKGLGNTRRKMWSDSKGKGTIYLATDPDVAYSYAEEAEWLDEVEDYDKYADHIIILKIDTNSLDKSNFYIDENVLLDDDESNYTYEYHGIIYKNSIVDVINEQGNSMPYSHLISSKSDERQFEDLQYRNNNWYNGDIEVVSDASDEQPDFDDENTTRKINFSNVDKIFIVTVLGRPQFEVRASDRNEAARKVRKDYGQKVKILGIKEK